uniref:CDGSH iron-sulfur domain-containing protein 2 n=1 Tax=Sus scrofa TaxID=9823 RepID=A0A8D1U0W7_PIG
MSPLFQPLVHALVARLLVESGRDRGCGLRARRGASPAVEWIAAVTIAAGTAAIGYLAYKRFYVKDHRNKSMVNPHIQKDNPKVVHAFDMEDLGDKAVYCRCWRSKKSCTHSIWRLSVFLPKYEPIANNHQAKPTTDKKLWD